MTIATQNDFDWVHEMASLSLAISSKKNGLRSFFRDQNDQLFSRRAPDAPVLTQSVITLPHGTLSLCSFHNKLRHEQIFPFCMLIKAIAPVLAEKIENMWTDKILGFSGSSKG